MRTITREVFTVKELLESAKEKAHYNYCSNDSYAWAGENEAVLKEFTKIFPVSITKWEYGYQNFICFRFTDDEDIENLSGIRLLKYLYNNYYSRLFKGKYFYKSNYANGQHKYRHSRIIMDNCCVLTGYCIDDDILEPIYKFLKNPCKHITFNDLLDDCLQSWVIACSKDYEAYYDIEHFEEIAKINNWEFYEDGTMV
jgi:hypothetical protein